jgi:hypothetical protein
VPGRMSRLLYRYAKTANPNSSQAATPPMQQCTMHRAIG